MIWDFGFTAVIFVFFVVFFLPSNLHLPRV